MLLDLADNQAVRDAFRFAYEEITEDSSAGDFYRLNKGVMRYFAAPEKLELEIISRIWARNLRMSICSVLYPLQL